LIIVTNGKESFASDSLAAIIVGSFALAVVALLVIDQQRIEDSITVGV
jgi:hypothetical protein